MARTRKGTAGTDAAEPEDGTGIGAADDTTDAAQVLPEPVPERDVAPQEEPETAAAPGLDDEPTPAPLPSQPAPRRGGFVPTVLGGAIAAGLGFGAATYILPRIWVPQVPVDETASVREGLAEQSARLDALTRSVEALAARPAASDIAKAQAAFAETTDSSLADLRSSLSTLDTSIAGTASRLDAVDARLTALEKRPVEGGAASATALDAFGREIEAFRSEMAGQKTALSDTFAKVQAEAAGATETMRAAVAEADRLRTEAEEAAKRTTARAALSRIEAALTAGGVLDPALADLKGAGIEVPQALAEQGQGVPTLDALRAAFPPAARGALAASLAESAGGSLWDRTLGFLRTQSGARSLTPREGADPDAVLSRAEAALAASDLGAAIGEIGTLPADGQARMAEWVALAKRRIAATSAAAALAAEVK